MQEIRRGDIFFADLGQGVGSEQMGKRPVAVLQNDIGNKFSSTVIIAAITSNGKDFVTHLIIDGPKCGLKMDSAIELEQIRTIDKRRLREKIGHIPPEVMELVNEKLDISLGRETKVEGAGGMEIKDLTVKQVNFNGDTLLAVKDNVTGKVHISINHICNGLGIDARVQRDKLKEHATLTKGCTSRYIPSNGGMQETFTIELEFLPLWLAGINPARVDPESQGKLIDYQLKAKDALAEAFLGKALKLPVSYAEALRELADKVEENQQLKTENEQLKPAANFGNAIKNNDGLILIRDYVKVLANAGIKIKQHELFAFLSPKYLYQNSYGDYIARIEYVEQGLFKVHETPIESHSGSFVSYTSKLTGKGQEYFLRKLRDKVYA